MILAAAVAALWGFNFVVIDWGMQGVPPLLFVAIRFLVVSAAVVFVPRPRTSWRTIVGVGLFMSLGQFGLLYTSMALGLQPEDRVAIAMNTRIEWIFVDLAIMASGGATTTVYPSTQADDVAYIISDSGSRYVVVEDASAPAAGRGASKSGCNDTFNVTRGCVQRFTIYDKEALDTPNGRCLIDPSYRCDSRNSQLSAAKRCK